MEITVEVEGFGDMENFLEDYKERHVKWPKTFMVKVRRELRRIGPLVKQGARDLAPYKTGKLYSRISYKVPVWNKLLLQIKEDYWQPYGFFQNYGWTHWKSGVYYEGKKFMQKGMKKYMPELLINAMKKFWDVYWEE